MRVRAVCQALALYGLDGPSLRGLVRFADQGSELRPFEEAVCPATFPGGVLVLLVLLSTAPVVSSFVPYRYVSRAERDCQ